jgi:hypothetical protein
MTELRVFGGGRAGLSTYELYLQTVPDDETPLSMAAWLERVGATGEARDQAIAAASTATGAASTATTQAGIATTQAGIATTQAGIATTQAEVAAEAANNAQTLVYASRAAFVAASTPPSVSRCGFRQNDRVFYLLAAPGGPIVQSGGRAWVPDGDITPEHFGAANAETVNDHAAFQSMFDYIIAAFGSRFWRVRLLSGDGYRIEDELSLLGFTGEINGAIVGDGPGVVTIDITPFGGAKALFRFPDGVPVRVAFENFRVRGRGASTSVNRRRSPTIFWIPDMRGRTRFNKVDLSLIGGSGLVSSNVFNVDFLQCSWFGTGWQPLVREVDAAARVTAVADSTTLTASASIFSADDVGRGITIANVGPGGFDRRNAHGTTVAAYVSPTEVTLTDAPSVSRENETLSFDSVRASVVQDSNVVIFSAPHGLESDDIGRLIYIDRADLAGRVLVAVLAGITNATTVALAAPVPRTASDVLVWFGVAIGIGRAYRTAMPGTGFLNDISFSQMQIENYRGVGLFIGGGTHAYASMIKAHGVARTVNDFGVSLHHIVINRTTRCDIQGGQFEHGNPPLDAGYIVSRGESQTHISGSFNAIRSGGPIFDAEMVEGANLIIGPGSVATRLDTLGSIVHVTATGGGNASDTHRSRVTSYGGLRGHIETVNSGAQPPVWGGRFRSSAVRLIIENDQAVFIPGPFGNTQMIMAFTTESSSGFGMCYLRVNNAPIAVQINAGANTAFATGVPTGTTGDPGALTIYPAEGGFWAENRMGSARTFHHIFLT